MVEENQKPSDPAPKGSESDVKPAGKATDGRKAQALAAALRANLTRRKARDRALRDAAKKTDSEG